MRNLSRGQKKGKAYLIREYKFWTEKPVELEHFFFLGYHSNGKFSLWEKRKEGRGYEKLTANYIAD